MPDPKIINVPVGDIEVGEHRFRQHDADADGVKRLEASVAEHGFLPA